MTNYDYLIVGAGLYGATFARKIAEAGKTCLVIDKRNEVGGNCHDYVKHGIHVHKHGAHIFHTSNEKVWNFANQFSKFRQFQNNVKAKSYGKLYSLPFNMNTFYELYGVTEPLVAEQLIKNEVALFAVDKPKNLEEQALSLVGRKIYETLIRDYTEKQWGKSCKELSSDIIKRLPLRFTYDNNYFNDIYQGLPENGYTALINNMLTHNNIVVQLGIDFSTKKHINQFAKKIVYSGQIDRFFDYCYGRLEWRTLKFEVQTYETENYQGCAVMNYCDKSKPFTRVIEHKHFLKEKSDVSIVTTEFPKTYEDGDEPYYPLLDDRNKKLYDKYASLAKITYPNVIFGGRLGTYQYLDMDKVILQAMNDVELELSHE